VIDDGSTDDTSTLLQRIRDDRLRVLHTAHGGAGAARNAGLAVARGELVAYLDTDNVWHPQFLEVLTGELAEDEVLAYCGLHRFLVEGDRGQWHIIGRKVESRPFNPVVLRRGSLIDTNAALHRRSVLDEVGGFDEGLPRFLDWDLLARIGLQHPFGVRHVDQVLVDYYYFPSSMTPSLTNAAFSDAHLRSLFGLGETDETTARVRRKLERVVRRLPLGAGGV
jgi:glycosyltransferase involved in cell wall biosynthesis